jgi:hypothetical protein
MEVLVRAFRLRACTTAVLEGNHEDIFNHYHYRIRLASSVLRQRICAPAHRPKRHLDSSPCPERFCRPSRNSNRHRDNQPARDGDITVSRSFKHEGASDTFFYRDITDSENNATIHTGKELKTKTRWDHDVLKVTNTNTQSGVVTLETYTLAADGTMLVSVLRPEHKPISLLFQRK